MPRKTVDVESFKDMTNKILRISTVDPAMRKGWMAALEWVLHETNNYRGFRYLTVDEVPAEGLPGIRTDNQGNPLPEDLRWQACDETRRAYS